MKVIKHKITIHLECWRCSHKTTKEFNSYHKINTYTCPMCSDFDDNYIVWLDPVSFSHNIELDFKTFNENSFTGNNYIELFPISCEDEERNVNHFKQLLENQTEDTETYSLYTNIAMFIYPRLKLWIEREPYGHPDSVTYEEWKIILNKILATMKIIADDEDTGKHNELKEGMDLFRQYFFHLWD